MKCGWNLAVVVALFSLALPAQADDPVCVGWIGIDSGGESGADIWLDGKKLRQQTPATLKDVPCGKHTVVVKKPLFRGGRTQVRVRSGAVAKVRIVLKPDFGSLEVRADPRGAEIALDGKVVGKAPVVMPKVQAGSHTVVARLPDHAPLVRKLVVKRGKKTSLKIKLKPEYGQIRVTSKPVADALIRLDGDPVGPAPMTLKRIGAGAHRIRLTADLYSPFETTVQVRPGMTAQVTATLKPNFGTVAIRTRPEGGRLRVDGKQVGQSPTTLKLTPGTHEVWASGSGPAYRPVKTRVRVKLGGKHKLVLKLPVRTGSLMVDTVPFAATIEIDGKVRGKAPLSLRSIPIGAHVLVARIKGYPPLAGRIEVVEAKRSVVEMNLKQPNRSVYRSPKSTTAEPAVQPGPTVASARPRPTEPAPETAEVASAEPAPEKTEPPKGSEPVAQPAKSEASPRPKGAAAKRVGPNKSGATRTEPKEVARAEPEGRSTSGPVGEPLRETDTGVTARAAVPMSGMELTAWITGGTAAAAAVTAAVLWGVGYATQLEADDAYDAYRDPPRTEAERKKYQDLDSKAATLYNSGWVLAGVALAAGGASVVLFLLDPEPGVDASESPRDALRFSPLPGGAWVGYELRF